MKITSVLEFALYGLALALPPSSADNKGLRSRQLPEFAPNGPLFRLQTRLVNENDTTKANFSGLYISSYHTGAGLSDAVFIANETRGVKAFLNESVPATATGARLEFDFGNDFPWGLTLGYQSYAKWSPVYINAGIGDVGYIYDDRGLVYNQTQFSGWLVCDWWHNVPQLFWLMSVPGAFDIPSSCAEVQLLKTNI